MPRYLLSGTGGLLGAGLAATRPDSAELHLFGRRPPPRWQGLAEFHEGDLRHPEAFADWVRILRPDAVLHAAALSRVGDCAANPAACRAVNVAPVAPLASACRAHGAALLLVSTDMVFGGRADSYREEDPPDPCNLYGRTKAAAERWVIAAGGAVARLPLLLGASGPGFRGGADAVLLAALAAGERPTLYRDEIRVPVAAELAAEGLWRWLADPLRGIFHLVGSEALSRIELGRRVCRALGIPPNFESLPVPPPPSPSARRPRRLHLLAERSRELLGWDAPDLRQSLARCLPASP